MLERETMRRNNEKEILLRMIQSLQSEIKAQTKGFTDVTPYANRYNFLRERIVNLLGEDSKAFLPELSEILIKHARTAGTYDRINFYDEITVAINQMVTFLETNVGDTFRRLTGLEEFLYSNLRKCMIKKPEEEKDVQNVIETMLISRGYVFDRERVKILYSNKDYIPDFTFEDLNAVLEVKLCKTGKNEKDIIDEINADIPAYTTKFSNVTFLVYDLEVIRDADSFREDIEKNNPRIKVLIIKH
jgi:hypothetical protein